MATSAPESQSVSSSLPLNPSSQPLGEHHSLHDIPDVSSITRYLHSLLITARKFKAETTVLPPLPAENFQNALSLNLLAQSASSSGQGGVSGQNDKTLNPEDDSEDRLKLTSKERDTLHSNIGLAARRVFYGILSSVDIASPEFVDMWNLLDILLFTGNEEQCDPGLMTALVEELMDSSSIDGCRLVFDYLESRREALVVKHFEAKQTRNLITLRSCSELLRRLSRADEAVFCGRVFIFLFKSFPLGEKGWVNHKGEFNVENVTTYSLPSLNSGRAETNVLSEDAEMQDVGNLPASNVQNSHEAATVSREKATDASTGEPAKVDIQNDSFLRELYPKFWAMQEVFSNPLRISNDEIFAQFKNGLVLTLECFKSIRPLTSGSAQRNQTLFQGQSLGTDEAGESLSSLDVINPKYLTSFDLFHLELSDLSFQRNILVQALILIDFLLSLTPEAKQKVAHLPNKSIQYTYTLSESDTKWATETRARIAEYLQSGPDGKFYYRMVDSVLSLDRNWVYWKMENCPPIARESVPPEAWVDARENLVKRCKPRPIQSRPLGGMDFSFLEERGAVSLEMLEKPISGILSVSELIDKAEVAELDLDFAINDEEKQEVHDLVTTATWCALRTVAKTDLSLLAEIGTGMDVEKLREVLAPKKRSEDDEVGGGEYAGDERTNGQEAKVKGASENEAETEATGRNGGEYSPMSRAQAHISNPGASSSLSSSSATRTEPKNQADPSTTSTPSLQPDHHAADGPGDATMLG